MGNIGVALIVLGCLGMAISMWTLVCNKRTYDQRVEMIGAIFGLEEYKPYALMFDEVDYDAHLFRLATFRNPYTLYAPRLRLLMGQGVEL